MPGESGQKEEALRSCASSCITYVYRGRQMWCGGTAPQCAGGGRIVSRRVAALHTGLPKEPLLRSAVWHSRVVNNVSERRRIRPQLLWQSPYRDLAPRSGDSVGNPVWSAATCRDGCVPTPRTPAGCLSIDVLLRHSSAVLHSGLSDCCLSYLLLPGRGEVLQINLIKS